MPVRRPSDACPSDTPARPPWTWEGWGYLATVIDLSSHRVAGWALADHMHTELVSDALGMAIGARRPAAGLIFHSDRGTHVQHTSKEFTDLLAER